MWACCRQESRVVQALQAGQYSMRSVHLALEHERMHQETLAYMQAQQRKRSFEANLEANCNGTKHSRTNEPSNEHQGSDASMNQHAANGNGMSNANGLHPKANGKLADGGSHNHTSNDVQMIACPAGMAVLGVDAHPHVSFVWDNEGPQQVRCCPGRQRACCRPSELLCSDS